MRSFQPREEKSMSTMSTHTAIRVQPRRTGGRFAYASFAALALAAVCLEISDRSTGLWQALVLGLGPDIALFYGASARLEKGQLHPRAVGLYNLLHRFWLPTGLVVLASVDVIPLGFFIGSPSWCFHIALDRALCYGLRTRDGFQRS